MSHYPPPPYPYPPPSPYPSPYAGPGTGGYGPAGSPAARRAGTMLFVLGPLTVLLGGCVGLVGFVFVAAPSTPELEQARRQVFPPGASPQMIEAALGVFGGIIVVFGLVLVGLAAFVRRGRPGATVAALVLVAIGLLFVAANAVSAVLHAGASPLGALIAVLITAAFGLELAWLVAALRAGPGAGGGDPYQQYLAHWYQYQQQAGQQPGGYGSGTGYGAPPAVEPPPPPA